MSHNVKLLDDSFYINGASNLAASWWANLDTAQSKLINGDAGGTWNPTASIIISGAGMWFCGPSPLSGGANVTISTSGPLVHSDSDYLVLATGHTGASRTLITSCDLGVDISSGQAVMLVDASTDGLANYTINSTYRAGGRAIFQLRVHHGATLASVGFVFKIATGHAGIPAQLPLFRVFKVDADGNQTPLFTGAGSLGNGYIQMGTPSSVTVYQNTAALGYTCDAGIIVDSTKYTYFAEVVDEAGTNALGGNVWESVQVTVNSIPNLGPQ